MDDRQILFLRSHWIECPSGSMPHVFPFPSSFPSSFVAFLPFQHVPFRLTAPLLYGKSTVYPAYLRLPPPYQKRISADFNFCSSFFNLEVPPPSRMRPLLFTFFWRMSFIYPPLSDFSEVRKTPPSIFHTP